MPSVANCGEAVDVWYETESKGQAGSSIYDVCNRCLPDVEEDPALLKPFNGDPLGEWIEGEDHPPYEDEDYRCAVCNKLLTMEDD